MLEFLLDIFFEKRFDSRETIVMLDTGVNLTLIDQKFLCKKGLVNLSNESDRDQNGHGTTLFQLAQTLIDPSRQCIQPIKTITDKPSLSTINYMYGLIYLTKYRFEKLVLAFEDQGFYQDEIFYLNQITKYAKIYVAAGNGGVKLSKQECSVYPACLSSYLENDYFFVVSDYNYNTGDAVDFYYNSNFQNINGSSVSAMRAACD